MTHKRSRPLAIAVATALSALSLAAPAAHAGGWTSEMPITTATDSEIGPVALVSSHDGTVVAAWLQRTGTGDIVRVSVRDPGGSFSPSQALSTDDTGVSLPVVAIDELDNITVAWSSIGGGISASYRPAGGTWPAAPQGVSTGNGVKNPSLAAGPHGGAIVVWTKDTSGTTERVNGAILPPGAAAFGAPMAISPTGGAIEGQISAAMDDAGDVAVMWQRLYDPGDGVTTSDEATAKAADAATFPTTSPGYVQLSFPGAGFGSNPSSQYNLAMNHRGDITAMWDYQPAGASSSSAVYVGGRPVTTSFGASTWSVSHQASPDNRRAGVFIQDDPGELIALWRNTDGTESTIGAIRSPLGAFLESPLTGQSVSGQGIAGSPSGDAMAVWQSGQNDGTIVASHRPSGGAFPTTPQSLAAGDPTVSPAVHVADPSVAVDDQGNAYVSYLRYVSGIPTLNYRVYDNAPPFLVSKSIPKTADSGVPVTFSVSATDRASAVSYHWDFGDGTTADGDTVTHTFAGPLTVGVSVTLTDGGGNTSLIGGTVTVAAPPSAPTMAPTRTPSPTPPPAQKLPTIQATVSSSLSVHAGITRFTKLTVKGIHAGDTLTISCTGSKKQGCTKSVATTTTLKKTPKAGGQSLVDQVSKVRLATGATLTIAITRFEFAAKHVTFTIGKTSGKTKTATTCLSPGLAAYAC